MKHYIGMGGMHGYMPNFCDVYSTYKNCIEGIACIQDLGKNRKARLKRDGCLELNLRRDGNEYVEIQECDCNEPWIHQDGESKDSWIKEYGEEFGIKTEE